jgi:ASC-1-like (ASCH) protein
MQKIINLSIGKTTITKEPDYDADTSYLGEYTDKITDNVIVRKYEKFYQDLTEEELEEIPERSNEYRGFKPPIRNYTITSDNPDEETKKYCLQDYQVFEDLNNQQWGYCAIVVKTEVIAQIPSTENSKGYTEMTDNTVSSLYGIEDHWDKDSKLYIESTIEDLKKESTQELLKMGFSEKEIDDSLNNAIEKVDW